MPLMSNSSTFFMVGRTAQLTRALATLVVGVVMKVGATAAIGFRRKRTQLSPKRLSSRSHIRTLWVGEAEWEKWLFIQKQL